MHNFEVLQLPFHLGCLDRLQVQHEEKSFIAGASSMMAVLASIWGAFFSVTFKLPFHALPLLSPHPASFRSFTPWASSSFFSAIILCTATNLQSHEAKSQTDMESSCARNNWDPLDDTHMEETTQAASSTAKPEAEETASRETGPTPTQETKRNHETWQDIASCQTPFDTAHEIHEIA